VAAVEIFAPSAGILVAMSVSAHANALVERARDTCPDGLAFWEQALPGTADHRMLDAFAGVPAADTKRERANANAMILFASASSTDALAWMFRDAEDFSSIPEVDLIEGSKWYAAAMGLLDCGDIGLDTDVPQPFRCIATEGLTIRSLLKTRAGSDTLAASLREAYETGHARCKELLQ